MKQRRYFIMNNTVGAMSPLAEFELFCQALEQHNDWDEVPFNQWWAIHWECTDFTDPCPPVPTEESYWKSLE